MVDNATRQIDAINRRIAQMRAPIDRMSRSVSRLVDVSGLRKVAQGFDWIGKAAGTALGALRQIVPVMGAITGAASIAGMVKLVQSYAAWSHELVQSADNIGITTQQLQQFQDATRLAGGNAEDMTEGLKALHTAAANVMIGLASPEQIGWLNHLDINVRDANQHLRNMTDLLPEVEQKIADLKDPADRARAATALLGAEGGKLVESFRQTHRPFSQFLADAGRYTDLTNEQKQSLQLFTEAQGRLGVGFDRLGQQISAMVAQHFTPLLQKFAIFVEKHTPAILGAVDRLMTKFAAWLEDPATAKAFVAGIKSVCESLVWVSNNLDTVKRAAEDIAILFATKWAVGMVASIATVVTALGPVTASLAAIAALIATFEANKAGQQAIEKRAKGMGFDKVEGGPLSLPSFRNPTTGENLSYAEMMQRQGKPSGGGGFIEKFFERLMKGPEEIQQPSPIQRQSATGGYLPGGVTRASYGGVTGGVATVAPSEFWDSMARATAKGFEDAWDRISETFGGGGGGRGGGGLPGGVTQAAYRVPAPPAGTVSPNITPAVVRPPGPAAPLGAAGGKSAFYDEQRKLIYDAAVKAGLPHPEVVAEVGASQAMLESGGGQHTPGGHNVYGIKAGGGVGGAGAPVSTQEEGAGGRYTTQASFATFGSKEEAAAGYVEFLKRNPRYAAVLQAPTVEAGLQAQGRSGYATASNYQSSLEATQRRYGGAAAPPAPPAAAAPPVAVPPQKPVNGSVDVNITHKNPPPNSAVTATGSGAVTVPPVRIEHQNMADI